MTYACLQQQTFTSRQQVDEISKACGGGGIAIDCCFEGLVSKMASVSGDAAASGEASEIGAESGKMCYGMHM